MTGIRNRPMLDSAPHGCDHMGAEARHRQALTPNQHRVEQAKIKLHEIAPRLKTVADVERFRDSLVELDAASRLTIFTILEPLLPEALQASLWE